MWYCTEDIINIEHDVVPTTAQFYDLMNCRKSQYCTGVYYLMYESFTEPHYSASYWVDQDIYQVKEGEEWCQWPSLGFVKFGAPRPKLLLDEGFVDGKDHVWSNLDCALQGTFFEGLWIEAGRPDRNSFKPWHVHWPIVTHNTPLLQKFERDYVSWPKNTISK
jgi:hypothetical protein